MIPTGQARRRHRFRGKGSLHENRWWQQALTAARGYACLWLSARCRSQRSLRSGVHGGVMAVEQRVARRVCSSVACC